MQTFNFFIHFGCRSETKCWRQRDGNVSWSTARRQFNCYGTLFHIIKVSYRWLGMDRVPRAYRVCAEQHVWHGLGRGQFIPGFCLVSHDSFGREHRNVVRRSRPHAVCPVPREPPRGGPRVRSRVVPPVRPPLIQALLAPTAVGRRRFGYGGPYPPSPFRAR
jgi:hypothetical protein